ncbi:MAG: hypothetical protein AAF975_01500, partial [Spirochaetota bacterium]
MEQRATKKKGLLFLGGGISAENQISLLSAQNVYPHIDRNLFDVWPVFIAPDGQWWLLDDEQAGNWPQLANLFCGGERIALRPLAGGLAIHTRIREGVLDLIFPMMHGPFGEDGTIQGLAQFFGVPVVGSDMSGSLINMDKLLMKAILAQKDIPCARYRGFSQAELQETDYRSLGAELFSQWQCPSLFVKPARMGSSIGISQVHDPSRGWEGDQGVGVGRVIK